MFDPNNKKPSKPDEESKKLSSDQKDSVNLNSLPDGFIASEPPVIEYEHKSGSSSSSGYNQLKKKEIKKKQEAEEPVSAESPQ